jgi:hypothetical protein
MQIAYKQVSLPWLIKLYGKMLNGQTVCFEPLIDVSFFLPCSLGSKSISGSISQTALD